MNTKMIAVAGVAALVAGGGAAVWVTRGATPDTGEGAALYQDNCASCHGANLEGQPDWRSPGPDGVMPAPPHDETGHTWHHGDGYLFAYTKFGGRYVLDRIGVDQPSGMPGFEDALSDDQIVAVLNYIRSTWPAKAREVQAARTEAERQ